MTCLIQNFIIVTNQIATFTRFPQSYFYSIITMIYCYLFWYFLDYYFINFTMVGQYFHFMIGAYELPVNELLCCYYCLHYLNYWLYQYNLIFIALSFSLMLFQYCAIRYKIIIYFPIIYQNYLIHYFLNGSNYPY